MLAAHGKTCCHVGNRGQLLSHLAKISGANLQPVEWAFIQHHQRLAVAVFAEGCCNVHFAAPSTKPNFTAASWPLP